MSEVFLHGQGGSSGSGTASKFEYTVTLPATWGDTAPYIQTVSINGMLADDEPHIAPIYSEDMETAILEKKSWNLISQAETNFDSITFTCFEKAPEQQLTLKIEVIRNVAGDPAEITCESIGAAKISDLNSKQDKLVGTAGQFVGFDSNGDVISTELDLASKQDKLVGTAGQVVGFDSAGNAIAQAFSGGCKIETKTYTGNNTNVTLNFEIEPKLVIITRAKLWTGDYDVAPIGVFMRSNNYGTFIGICKSYDTLKRYMCSATWGNKSLTWDSSASREACCANGTVIYSYTAIG